MEERTNWLCHYGVKGMKWGVRKDRSAARSIKRDRKATVADLSDRYSRMKKRDYPWGDEDVCDYELSLSVRAISKNGKRLSDDQFGTMIRQISATMDAVDKAATALEPYGYNFSKSPKGLAVARKVIPEAESEGRRILELVDEYNLDDRRQRS